MDHGSIFCISVKINGWMDGWMDGGKKSKTYSESTVRVDNLKKKIITIS
jgi:hypothetical protein